MGLLTWTDLLANGDNQTATHITTMKSDITAILNGNITNSNVNASAGIVESKLAFSTSTGHDHDGTDSKRITMKHYIKGGKITRVDANNITVGPTVIDISGTQLISVAASSNIDVSGANYITPSGGSAGDEPAANDPIYIYAYNNSGTLAFKLGDENAAPTLSYSDDTTAEYPLRYIKDSSSVYYRLIGVIENGETQALESDGVAYVDKGFICGSFVSSNADWEITTIWTPRYIKIWSPPDDAPDTTDLYTMYETFEYGEKTADPHLGGASATAEVTFEHGNTAGKEHELMAEATAGNIKGITQQAAGTAGAFTIHAPTDNIAVYYTVWTENV